MIELVKTLYMKRLISNVNLAHPVLAFFKLIIDEMYRGLFSNHLYIIYDFSFSVVEIFMESEEESANKGIRVDFSLPEFMKQLNRLIGFNFGEIESKNYTATAEISKLLRKIIFYEKIVFHPKNNDLEFFKVFTYHFSKCIIHNDINIFSLSIKIWKLLLQKKEIIIFAIFKAAKLGNEILEGFLKNIDDDQKLQNWINSNKDEIDSSIEDSVMKTWELMINVELKNVKEAEALLMSQRVIRSKLNHKRRTNENEIIGNYTQKYSSWINDVQIAELKKLQRFKQDYEVMQETIESEWRIMSRDLISNHSIWEKFDSSKWMLDFTEGRTRMRKRLRIHNKESIQPYLSKEEHVAIQSPNKDAKRESRAPSVSKSKTNKELLEHPLFNEQEILEDEEFGYGIEEITEDIDEANDEKSAMSHEQDDVEWEHITSQEDQNRKIARLLDPSDEIIEITNSGRLLGLELCEGISIIGKKNFYIIDNYFQRQDGDVIEIDEVTYEERNIYHWIVTASERKNKEKNKPRNKKDDYHTCRKCSFSDIREVHKRLYLFRNVALELFMDNGRNYFLTFWTSKERDLVYGRLLSKANSNPSESVAGVSSTQNQLQSVIYGGSPLAELTQKWCNREISNLAYLMHINTLAGRSYNDLTQYPIFPWIVADYDSETLDLASPKTFRDLSKPMGGQGEKRAEIFKERFLSWDDNSIPACHYGTHYSTSMVVCSYLIRIEPFTKEYLNLQGGSFDRKIFH